MPSTQVGANMNKFTLGQSRENTGSTVIVMEVLSFFI